MKKQLIACLACYMTLLCVGCTEQKSNSFDSAETTSSTQATVPDMDASDALASVTYEGTTYFGLIFGGDVILKPKTVADIVPEEAALAGKTASDCLESASIQTENPIPTEERQTNWTDSNSDLYVVMDGEEITSFYGIITSDNQQYVVQLKNLTTDIPYYYHE